MDRNQPSRRVAMPKAASFKPNSSHKKITPRQRAVGSKPGGKGGKGRAKHGWGC